MGYIYLIRNKINDKKYIGKTEDTVENRWASHKKDMLKTTLEKRPLYEAMKKYGLENFSIETIERVDNTELAEKEIFYIEKYKTYQNGYNATTGGDGRSSIEKEEKDLYLEKFYELKTIKKVAEFFNRDVATISNHLKNQNIDPYMFREEVIDTQFKSRKILLVELNLEFDSVIDAAKYLVENNMTKAEVNSARVSIGRAISGIRKSYLGYTWKEV